MGARRIAGITVEIGGDTTKLTTALKDVDKALSTTQSSLRDVNKLLKLDPGNTELLAQKHRLLGEAVSETKEKLAILKTAAEQANQALANGEITQSQYDALQREIIETEQKLKDLERQAENSSVALQKIGQVGDKLQAVGDKVSGVGETLTKSVTAPVVGLGTAAVATAASFESSMSQVQATMGITKDTCVFNGSIWAYLVDAHLLVSVPPTGTAKTIPVSGAEALSGASPVYLSICGGSLYLTQIGGTGCKIILFELVDFSGTETSITVTGINLNSSSNVNMAALLPPESFVASAVVSMAEKSGTARVGIATIFGGAMRNMREIRFVLRQICVKSTLRALLWKPSIGCWAIKPNIFPVLRNCFRY